METLGAYFKSKREALNISLQEISQVTRIRRSILEAIENNRYDLLPPKVFAQGFIKNYASYLGLDESEVIKRYSEQVEGTDTEMKAAEVHTLSSPSRFPFILLLVAITVLLLAAVLLWRMNSRDKNDAEIVPQQQGELTTTSIMSVMPPPGEPAEDESVNGTAAPAETAPPVTDAEGSPATAVVEQQSSSAEPPLTATVEQQAATATGKPPADPSATPLVLKIVASQNTWLRIQSDKGKTVTFTLNSGQTRTVEAEEKFTMRIGNAGGVNLFLNEQELGKPGKSGEVLELTLPE